MAGATFEIGRSDRPSSSSSTSLHLSDQRIERSTITMAGLARDIYYEQYQECAALYDEKKWEECKKVGIRNMADCTMPRYLHIRTLILIAGAEEYSWYKGEVRY